MSIVNPLTREISAKVVYYGPGLSGKTTSLTHIHASVRPQRRGELVTLATEGDRTIFFDFLPLHIHEVRGMGVRFQLYTVPGQVFYEATRKLVLQGADGVVFVADSQPSAKHSNQESFADLERNLAEEDIAPEDFPIVFQFNKRDLPGVRSIDEMSADLNAIGAPVFPSSATRGEGVLPALKAISKLVLRTLWERFPETKPAAPPAPVPEEGIEAELARISMTLTGGELVSLVPTERQPIAMPAVPENALSFAQLWEGQDAAAVASVENAIREGAPGSALDHAVAAMVELLEALPGTGGQASPMAKAALLGLDGREFLRFCRLAGMQRSSVTEADSLFALYMLVSARLKASLV